MQKEVTIKNKRARFEFELMDSFDAGIQLFGTEIKSIRMGKASITESFCQIKDGEIYIINMFIDEYDWGTHYNHKTRRDRKLLLQKKEIKKLERKTKESGLTIVPTTLYINNKGFAKLRVYLAKGKKLYDKRETIKGKDLKRDLDRMVKNS
ncbi:SsrA-binding protein SmpB [Faecalibacter rhinopitheci]|uniref:SsrA-binding protein n=1 Tax=Faecalibacter rhinopitheci TaxID=2779678 RepID=A0A8J7G4Z2_9FLAO|nr:SsrA-binding protein SmpB [Faecalibacter rhinopitheci]MBF0596747.1 SsrA-binding protein SmpB [Faecalibacter rhinopitheci]MBQ0147593.1 SsrA-binding protein SmpB [Candidatus Onthonaster equi]